MTRIMAGGSLLRRAPLADLHGRAINQVLRCNIALAASRANSQLSGIGLVSSPNPAGTMDG
jgi:hypothetical protein